MIEIVQRGNGGRRACETICDFESALPFIPSRWMNVAHICIVRLSAAPTAS
jgi:hypothetical protein